MTELNNQQKFSDSVLHEARILFRQFATVQCPDKKAGAASLPNSSQAILSHILSQTRAKGLKGKHEDSRFYGIDKTRREVWLCRTGSLYNQVMNIYMKGTKINRARSGVIEGYIFLMSAAIDVSVVKFKFLSVCRHFQISECMPSFSSLWGQVSVVKFNLTL